MKPRQTTRRSFVKLAAAGVMLAGVGAPRNVRAQSLQELPPLDGQLLFDDAARQAAAVDYGGHVRRSPIAVLKARSAADVARMVAYANKHGLKIAMRGQGHSQYGQAQVEGGIVIDSSALNAVRWHGNDAVDAEPGALWGDVAKLTLDKKPHASGHAGRHDAHRGGTLSAGGIGETTYRYGAQVDNVLELDVVTGTGELMTCSPERNDELFRMTLAGLRTVRDHRPCATSPDCGAQIRLDTSLAIRRHGGVSRRPGAAHDGRCARAAQRPDHQGSGWALAVHAVCRTPSSADMAEGNRRPAWMADLRFKSAAPATTTSYWDYLDRRTASVVAGRARKVANATLLATLSDEAVRPFLAHVLATPDAFVGIWFFEVSAKIPARHTQPLQKTASGAMAFELRMQRRAPGADTPELNAMLAANHALLPRLQAAGGKIYPLYCPVLSREQWQVHYGQETWQRFAAAKRRFRSEQRLDARSGNFLNR